MTRLMARLITSGFEVYVNFSAQNTDADGTATSTTAATRATTGHRSGNGCLRVNSSANGGGVNFAVPQVNERGYWARCYIKIATLPTNNPVRLLYLDATSTESGACLNMTGQVFHTNAPGTLSASLNDGAWHRIEIYTFFSATQANRAWELRVDGTTISSGTAQAANGAAPQNLFLGWTNAPAATADVYFDDVALNDNQGSFQNSWPGDGYVICLLPTADSSRGSWTGGAGGTTSLFDALNNTPPIGATAPGTNLSQISANAVATTGLFDTQSYVAAGAGASDTVVGCSVVACTGEQVATGTKTGSASTVNTVNNTPTSTTGALNYGLDAGTEGAWPTLWRFWASPFTAYATQPTLTTGARLSIATTTTSRVADACFLGLFVELQPAAAPPATKKHPVVSSRVPVIRAATR